MTGYRVIPAPEALGRVVCRGVSVGAAVVCAGGAGMRVEGSSRMDGILMCLVVVKYVNWGWELR